MKKLVYIFLSFVILSSCADSTDDDASLDLGYNYYPAAVGTIWIYRVDSFSYDENSGSTNIDTFDYEYKEVITSILNSKPDGSYAEFLIDRYFKFSDTTNWSKANSWRLIKTNERIEKYEENVIYTKLLFPLTNRKEWDGNMANNKGKEPYTVRFFDEPFGTYPLACKIEQFREENLIEEIIREEVYSRNTGLVYALSDSLNTQVKGTRGYRLRKSLISFTP